MTTLEEVWEKHRRELADRQWEWDLIIACRQLDPMDSMYVSPLRRRVRRLHRWWRS